MPSIERVLGRFKISFMRSCVESRATARIEASSLSESADKGFESNAVKCPKSKDNGIAFCGFRELDSERRNNELTQCPLKRLTDPWCVFSFLQSAKICSGALLRLLNASCEEFVFDGRIS